MPPNETTILLTNYREKRILRTTSRTNYGSQRVAPDIPNDHIVVNVGKDPNDGYQPIFPLEEYPSSLSLAELLPFQDDPWWQKFRVILFLLFWIVLFLTLIAACLIAYMEFDGTTTCPALVTNSISTTSSSSSLLTSSTSITTTMSSILTSKLAIMP
ncbi:uncharacterized protein [Musca autumnalis]|uniref:uncharacterized protein n=1 Tax=Musca autumnalis TaxID=221902 RepID=UPI003CF80409